MGKNIKGLLAGTTSLIVISGFSGYGYFVQHEHLALITAIIIGVLLVGIDWAVRKPGRTSNKKVIGVAYAIGILGGPIVHFVWGENIQFSIAVYLSGLCFPLVLYLLIAMAIHASKNPGYWSR